MVRRASTIVGLVIIALLGRVTELSLAGEIIPARFAISRGNFAVSRYVGETGLWGWSVFPENFDAPELVELAKLQSWTLTPALLVE